MPQLAVKRIGLSTGVTLSVQLGGAEGARPVILLHGFPESHRTWRSVAPVLASAFRVIAPDQRGFAASDKPQEVEAYRADAVIDDIFALADALELESFALVGHDWGGAIAWGAALRGDPRLTRLAIINAPHPLVFQKSLIESLEQRAASQYITAFRSPGFEKLVERMGCEAFFEKSFGAHVDLALISEAERQLYIGEWSRPGALTAMLNWYRASRLVVPPISASVSLPDWVLGAFPHVKVPTLVIWGMRDKALLPIQLEGLEELVDDLEIVRLADAGHFAPWEKPEPVAGALTSFIAENDVARA